MSGSEKKKRKFLNPIEFTVATILSIATPVVSATTSNNGVDTNSPGINQSLAQPAKQKPLLIQPANKGKTTLAGHYSHSSHSSHSSHASHYSSSR